VGRRGWEAGTLPDGTAIVRNGHIEIMGGLGEAGVTLADLRSHSWIHGGVRFVDLDVITSRKQWRVVDEQVTARDTADLDSIYRLLLDPARGPLPEYVLVRQIEQIRAIMPPRLLEHPLAPMAIHLAANAYLLSSAIYGPGIGGRVNLAAGSFDTREYRVPMTYHNAAELLAALKQLLRVLEFVGARPDEILAAMVADAYSDANYNDGRESDNPTGYDELKSARLARAHALHVGFPPHLADLIFEMIVNTGFNQTTGRQKGQHHPNPIVRAVCGIDLQGLPGREALALGLAIIIEDMAARRAARMHHQILSAALRHENAYVGSVPEAVAFIDEHRAMTPLDGPLAELTLQDAFGKGWTGNGRFGGPNGFTFPDDWPHDHHAIRADNEEGSTWIGEGLLAGKIRPKDVPEIVAEHISKMAKKYPELNYDKLPGTPPLAPHIAATHPDSTAHGTSTASAEEPTSVREPDTLNRKTAAPLPATEPEPDAASDPEPDAASDPEPDAASDPGGRPGEDVAGLVEWPLPDRAQPFRHWLKAARRAHRLTQAQLAARMGVPGSATYIGSLEGGVAITRDMAVRLLDGLGASDEMAEAVLREYFPDQGGEFPDPRSDRFGHPKDWILAARTSKGLSRRELAARAGVGLTGLSMKERTESPRGEFGISPDYALRLLTGLDAPDDIATAFMNRFYPGWEADARTAGRRSTGPDGSIGSRPGDDGHAGRVVPHPIPADNEKGPTWGDAGLLGGRWQLADRGFSGAGGELVLKRPEETVELRRAAASRLHPHGFSSAANWARAVRRSLRLDAERMDELISAPSGTWQEVESGQDLSIGQVRALLRRVPGARGWYSALATGFFSDLAAASPRLGSNLRSIRERAQIRAEELAVRLGVSVVTLGERETRALGTWSPEELLWYLRGLASLLPATAVAQARLGVAPRGGGGVGMRLAALRIAIGLHPRVVAEKAGVEPGVIHRIESGVVQPSVDEINAYMRALAPGIPCWPEGCRNVGEYLRYLRQESGATLVAAATAVGMTTAMMDDRESGRVVPSVETVGAYLHMYSDHRVGIDECVEAFPELARRAAESEGAAAKSGGEAPLPVQKAPGASVVTPDAGSPDGVRLHETAELSDADDLLWAIVAGADVFAELDQRAGPILRRFSDMAEVTSDGDREGGMRSFAFRVFERKPDRTVVGRRRPKAAEVVVRLAKPAPAGDWVGVVAEVATRRDPALWKAARAPEASPDYEKAQRLIGPAVAVAAEALRPLGVTGLAAEYGPVDHGIKVRVGTAEGVREVPLSDRNTCRSITMMFRDRTTARFDVRVDPVHRGLVVSSPDGRLRKTALIYAPSGASDLELQHAVTEALELVLDKVVSIHRGHGNVSPENPRYVRNADGTLVATWAAHVDVARLLMYDRLLGMKPRTERQRRHLFDRRREILARLEFATGSRLEQRERLAALRAISARVEYPIRRHWGPLKIRKPLVMHPEAAPPFAVHYGLSLIAAASNGPTFFVSGDIGQQGRGVTGTVTGSLYMAIGRHQTYGDFAQERSEVETAPPYWVYERDGRRYFYGHAGGALFDAGARVGVSLILANLGIPIDAAMLGEIGARRASKGILEGMRAGRLKPMFKAPSDLTEQTLAVARRREVFDEYAKLRAESLLLARQLRKYLDQTNAPDDRELTELFDLFHDLVTEMRAAAEQIEKYGFGPAALRTKASPVRSPSGELMLKISWMPAVGSFVIGTSAAWMFDNIWIGLMGAGAVFWEVVRAKLSGLDERLRAAERAARVQRNNAHRQKQWDDGVRDTLIRIAELLERGPDIPDPLPDVKRKLVGNGPYTQHGLLQAGVEAPFSLLGFWIPGMGPELAWGFFFARFLSPITNGLRSWGEEIYDQFALIKKEEIDERIALEEGSDDMGELKAGIVRTVAGVKDIYHRNDKISDAAGYPKIFGAVSPAAVFGELMKRGETKKNSAVVLERFQQLAAEKNTPELFDAFIASITQGFEKLEPEERAGKAAAAFLYWHESRMAAIGKLEMVDRFIAEYIPPEVRLTNLFPEEKRTPLDSQYYEFARVVAKLPLVGAPPDPKMIEVGVLMLAAARNGVYVLDPENTEVSRLDIATLGNLLTDGAELIQRDIQRLAHGSNPDDLLTDTPPPRQGISIDERQSVGAEGAVGAEAHGLRLDTVRGEQTVSPGELRSAKNLLRALLRGPQFRAQYTDRITRWLAETRQPIVEDSGFRSDNPDPTAVLFGDAGTRSPLIDIRSAELNDPGAGSRPLPTPWTRWQRPR
jgi:transcriptional regulator with XRE-family HTH domain